MLSKGYVGAARTLLRVAQDMIDRTIADRLKALAEDYGRRVQKSSLAHAAKALAPLAARGAREPSTPK
jgi:hypothetical protein